MSSGKYFDDFEVGQTFLTAGRTLFEADVVNFIGIAGIYEELYTNREYVATRSLFRQPFAPGPLVFALSEGLVLQTGLVAGTGLALLEAHMTFVAPLFVGDTMVVEIEVARAKETSKPDRGVVMFTHTVKKTGGDVVMRVEKTRMVRRRADAPTEVVDENQASEP